MVKGNIQCTLKVRVTLVLGTFYYMDKIEDLVGPLVGSNNHVHLLRSMTARQVTVELLENPCHADQQRPLTM